MATAYWLRHRWVAAVVAVGGVLLAGTAQAGRVVVTNVTAQQRPLTPLVDITYDLFNVSGGLHTVTVEVSTNHGSSYLANCTSFMGAVGEGITTGEQKQVVWNAAEDLPNVTNVVARVRVTASDGGEEYLVIDVSGGPQATNYPYYYTDVLPVQVDEYKTRKIVLRKVPAGLFMMGSPTNELGRDDDEDPRHSVTLTKAFYAGIYEITQAQYSNVMGTNTAYFTQGAHGAKRPVEQVSWVDARGGTWPGGAPGGTAFLGKLRSKTGLPCDLPTEAQWEYACRAGTVTALNSGENLTNVSSDEHMNRVGRYWYNGGSMYSNDSVNGAHAAVGSYEPNQWGLYDMHGNVWEWCLDWYMIGYEGDATNPVGPVAGAQRVRRGGSWVSNAKYCRSAARYASEAEEGLFNVGFRIAVPAELYRITGQVSGDTAAGVTISASGSVVRSTVTDSQGNYTISGLVDGAYTVTPRKASHTFVPARRSVVINGADVSGVDFTASYALITYGISGRVSGDTKADVVIEATGAAYTNTVTDAQGNYTLSGLINGAYTVTASKVGYAFVPQRRVVTIIDADMSGVDFMAVDSNNWTAEYLVIDVSGGPQAASYPVSYATNAPPLDDEHKTGKIVLRKLHAGQFVMGSPTNELGRYGNEGPQHAVTLTEHFYAGVFEITQAQYSNVMGVNPAAWQVGAHGGKRPVESVSWNTVRGGVWPYGAPASNTLVGVLRAKTGLALDLPTEAQWEYACRAGTTRALNNNENLRHVHQDPNLDMLGRYWYNGGNNGDPVTGAHAAVGSYVPNAWGLYDMHGNVVEWCLDWYGGYSGDATDPVGPLDGLFRMGRGGGWRNTSSHVRSAYRDFSYAPYVAWDYAGVRLVAPAGPDGPYTLSGQVTGDTRQGVLMQLTGRACASTLSDVNGWYAFSGLADGTYTVRANKEGYTMLPASQSVTIDGANAEGINFYAQEIRYVYGISGQITGAVQQGVTLTLKGTVSGSTTTDVNGVYVFNGLCDGIYTVTPSRAGYSFTPPWQHVMVAGTNASGRDFAARQGIHGTGTYLIVDVFGGPDVTSYPVSYQADAPPLDEEHKTSKIVLRRIPAGQFVMGSPTNELGREPSEQQHTVTLTQAFYMGVFEITQGQYARVMGENPSSYTGGVRGPQRPVERVSWRMVRGGTWPDGTPDNSTFMGKLQSKTGLNFDLPTEAQWEYACRAGTTKALNNNTNLQSTQEDPNLNTLGRYWYNGGANVGDLVNGAHAPAGSYLSNQWGLYDMHGNVWEWCLDWFAGSYGGSAVEPAGPLTGDGRVRRGGGWGEKAWACRSAMRHFSGTNAVEVFMGFRVALPTGQ